MLYLRLFHNPHARQLLTPALFRFDSSVGRGDFVTAIGVGKVIKGNSTSQCSTKPLDADD
jgi:hypothetical protein